MSQQGNRLELEEITANWEIPRYCDVEYRDQRPNLQSSHLTMSCKLCLLEKCFINPEFHSLGTSAPYKCNM